MQDASQACSPGHLWEGARTTQGGAEREAACNASWPGGGSGTSCEEL